jgi:hypothetical protein
MLEISQTWYAPRLAPRKGEILVERGSAINPELLSRDNAAVPRDNTRVVPRIED